MICDVCGQNESLGVASSALAPISFAYCRECLDRGADHELCLENLYFMCNGDDSRLDPSVKEISTYKDGRYLTWSEWAEQYGAASLERLDAAIREYQPPADTELEGDDDIF